jgi:hypothetical protein
MILSVNQLSDLLAAGGNLVLDAPMFTLNDLARLATGAAKGKVTLTLRNVDAMTQPHLKEIAAVAPGHVVFELS